MKKHNNIRVIFSIAVRYLFAAIIITWLLNNDFMSFDILKKITITDACIAVILIAIQLILSGLRVSLLLQEHHISVSIFKCMIYNSVGIFYSLFLPGGMSGDVARAYYFWKECPTASKASLFGALFVDRLLGTVAMLLIGLVAGTCLAGALGLQKFMLFLWIGFISFCVLYFLCMRFAPKNKNLKGIGEKISRFIDSINIRNYGNRVLFITTMISIAAHLIAVFVIYLCSNLANSGMNFTQVMTVAPLGLLANALPLTPGGLGVGEQGFELLYQLVGGKEGANCFLLSRVFLFAPAILGAIFIAIKFIFSQFDFLFKRKLGVETE